MSDIGLRLDGLILILAIFVSGAVYAIVTGIALLTAWMSVGQRPKALRIARRGSVLVLFCVVAEAAAGVYFENVSPPTSGPDIIDWLTVPGLLLFVGGCIALVRTLKEGRSEK